MGCLKGKSKAGKDEAKYECRYCGSLVKDKKQVCKAKKLKS
jgi:hypothetical protein